MEAKLERVRDGEFEALINQAWEHHGTLCLGLNWERWSASELVAIAGCIGGQGLATVCRLLSQGRGGATGRPKGYSCVLAQLPAFLNEHLRRFESDSYPGTPIILPFLSSPYQGGMPDLLLWNVQDRRAKLVEVKSQRDRLSEQQRAWMLELADAGLDAEVFKVVDK